MTAGADDGLHAVRILRFPLQVHARAQEHSEAMRREFFLVLAQERVRPGSVPARLLELSAALSGRYSGFTEAQEREIESGIESGALVIDELVFKLPAHAAGAADELKGILEEADEWCRTGGLLTLATPPDLVTYRNWYLDNFARQLTGGDPVPWTGPLS